jgi:hypothetical protein
MAGFDTIRAQVAERLGSVLGSLGGDAGGREFGIGPLLTIAALARHTANGSDDDGVFRPIDSDLVRSVLTRVESERGLPVKPGEAERVLELLRNGELEGDLEAGVRAVLTLLGGLPRDLVSDVLSLPQLPGALVDAVTTELGSFRPGGALALLGDLRDGQLDKPPKIFPQTTRLLLREATARGVAETLRALLAEDNETFRLALIVYARSQGFELTDEDLDALRAAIDPDRPDLGALVARGLTAIQNHAGGPNEARNIIERLSPAGLARAAHA